MRVFDVGTLDDGGPYMVMEYLEGEDLGAVSGRGPLAREDAVDYIVQACEAMAEAHGLGIVHRDIKPENLFLARRGSGAPIIKIVDFGISKSAASADAGGRARRMTEDGDRFGTPMYMSPEQLASSANVDARTDIWALGVVLFELLTARLPFDGDNVPQIAAGILASPAKRLGDYYSNASPELEAALLKCLEKKPELRFRNVAELAQELAPFGSPASQRGVVDITRIVRDSGASIWPPRPMGVASAVSVVTPGAFRPVTATLDAISTPPGVSVRPSKIAIRAALGIAAIAALVVGSLAALGRAGEDRSTLLARPSSGLAETLASPPPPSATASAKPATLATVSIPLSIQVTIDAPAASAALVAKPVRPISTSPRPATAPLPHPSADYKEFGERR